MERTSATKLCRGQKIYLTQILDYPSIPDSTHPLGTRPPLRPAVQEAH